MQSPRLSILLLIALLFALMLALPSTPALAFSGAINSTYCTTNLHGTWSAASNSATCTILSGNTGTIASGDHVETYGDSTNLYIQIHVSSGATLVVAGTLALNGGQSTGSLVNDGTVTVSNSGEIDVNWDNSSHQCGWLRNSTSGTLTNNGILRVNTSPSQVFPMCSDTGWFMIDGTFTNNGTLYNSSLGFEQFSGTMTNNGEYTNNSGKLNNQGGTLTNTASIHFNAGTLQINGSLVNSSTGSIYLGNIANTQGASLSVQSGNTTFTNNGQLQVNSHSSLYCSSSNGCTNNGTVQTNGVFQAYSFTNASGSVIENGGSFYIRDSASNAGQFNNNVGGTLTNDNSATFTNQNLFNNRGTIHSIMYARFVNSLGATVENYAAFNNDPWSYVTNNGTINNYCGSTFTTSSVTFVGNPPVNNCIAPTFTSANNTAFVIGQNRSFSVTASGSPIPTLSMTSGTLPSGVTFTANSDGTATLAGTPASGTSTGPRTLTFRAQNDAGTATQSFTLNVNQVPAITSGDTATFTYGTSGSFTVTASGYPAPTFSLDTTGFGGLSFNTTTGVLSGTPTNAGTATRTLTASNGVSPNATQAFHIVVNMAATTTTLATAPNPSSSGQAVSLSATVAPAAATGDVQFYADGATFGPTVTVSSGIATTSISSLSAGTHPITATYSGNTNYSGSTSNQINQVVCGSSITVTNANNSGAGSLRQALADVCPGGVITFDNNYTITLVSQLVISRTVTIDGTGHTVTVSGNNAVRVFKVNSGVTFNLNQLKVADGNAPLDDGDEGGGIYNLGTLHATDVTFSGNTAGLGGGLSNDTSSATLTNVTFSGNHGTFGGGGMFNRSSSPTLTNVTFKDNSGVYNGGGLLNGNNSNPTLIHVTFSGNSADYGGGIYNDSSTATVRNSILWGNTATTAGAQIRPANSTSYTITHSIVQGGFEGTGNLDLDPLLAPLGSYGGSTQTLALLPGSAAINATSSNCISTDQRGVTRSSPSCDMGAFESQGFTLGSLTGTPQSTAIGTAFATPLGLTVTANDAGVPVTGGKVTFTPPGSGASAMITGSPATIAANGTASASATANDTVGSYNVNASGAGVATPAQFALTNNKGDPTVTLTSSRNPARYRESVTFVATVSSNVGTPGGDVQFYADGTPLGAAVSLSGGSASTSTASLDMGMTHPITATYSGDTNYNARTSNQLNQEIWYCPLTYTVTNANASGVGSLDQALAEVCIDGTVTFDADYTIPIGSELVVRKNVTVDGGGHQITVSGSNARRVFDVLSGVTLNLNQLTIANGNAALAGGLLNDGTLTATNVTFSHNNAQTGAALYNSTGSHATLNNVTFSDNGALSAAAVENYQSTVALANVTFSGNTVSLEGSAMRSTGSTVTLTNATLSNNTSAWGGALVFNGGTATIRNSILWGDNGGEISCSSCTLVVSNSIVQGGYAGSGNINVDPLLASLGSYSGSTQTFALLPGSPAINATSTNCPSTDQRGVTRSSPSCDVGAFESQGFTLGSASGTPQSAPVNTAFATPLGLTVAPNNTSEPVDGGRLTFTAPSSGATTTFAPTTTATIDEGTVSLSITANAANGSYTVTASAAGVSTPAQFALTNTGQAPSITTHPSDQTVCEVGTATFNSAATGDPTPTVQWQVRPPGGSWTNIGGMTNPTLSFSPSPAANGNQYHAIYTNVSGSATTNAATLTVNAAPAVTTHPSSQNILAGTLASFTAAATGDPTPTVQWQVSANGGSTWSNLAGATSTDYAFTATTADSGKQYHAVFTSPISCGSPAATNPATLTVSKANTTTSLTSNSPSLVGQSATFTTTVDTAVTLTPTGLVTFTINGGTWFSRTLANGAVTFSSEALAAGTHSLTAEYGGDANLNGSASSPLNHTVNQAPAITSVNHATFQAGAPGTFTVTATGYPAPTFAYTGDALPSGLSLNATSGVLSGTPAAAVSGVFNLTLRATNGVAPDATQAFTLAVNHAPAITSTSNATFIAGTAGSFNVTATGYPAPTFSLTSGEWPSGLTLNPATGVLSGTPATDTADTYDVTLAASNGVSPDASQAFTVSVNNPVPTLTTMSPTSASVNAADFTLTITGTNFVDSSVVRWDGSDRTTTFVSSTKLTAAISRSDLGAALPVNITVFNPAPGGGTSNTAIFTVTQANSAVTLTSSLNPSTLGQAVTFTATVTNTVGGVGASSRALFRRTDGVPGGTATFYDNGVLLGTATLDASGAATYATSSLVAGTHPITATYSGDPNFGPGTSNPVNQVVNYPIPTITSLSPTAAPVNAPDFTLTITGTNFIASSYVEWSGSALATTYVSSTKVTALVPKSLLSAAGPVVVTVYNPPGQESNETTFTINPTASTVSVLLTSSCNPCMLEQTVRLTATVTNTVGSSSSRLPVRRLDAVPTGTMTFQNDGNNIPGCVNLGLSGGQAVCNTKLSGGRHTITAHYSGDGNFNPASGTLTQDMSYLLLLPDIRKNGH